MNARKLMIGNWVQLDEPDKYAGYKCKIRSLSDHCNEDGFYLFVDIYEGGFPITTREVFNEDLRPIPLTRELLEKNGFDGDREVMQYTFEDPTYLVDGKPEKLHFSLRQMYDRNNNPHGYSFYAFSVLTIIDYVHQLQNAFELCGINKEIVV